MTVTAVLGAFWGDEGKGKVAAYLSRHADIAARFQGGPNAAHTVVIQGCKAIFRMIPAGIVRARKGVIGAGVMVNPEMLIAEYKECIDQFPQCNGRLAISDCCHIISQEHLVADSDSVSQRIGTTRMGMGPAYADKARRTGLRIRDLFDGNVPSKVCCADIQREFKQLFGSCCADTGAMIREALERNSAVIAEGAQGALLDIDHGDYPYVTSTNTTIGAVLSGLGIGPRSIGKIVLVASAYMTKVGGGAFPTRISGPIERLLQQCGDEVDNATGLLRDCGWLDLHALRKAAEINQADELILTKLDVLSALEQIELHDAGRVEYLPGWKGADISQIEVFEDLPSTLKHFVERIEALTRIPVAAIANGPEETQFIRKTMSAF